MVAEVCQWCGCGDTEKTLCVDSSPHYASLHCKECHRWIKWLSKPKVDEKEFPLSEIVEDIGLWLRDHGIESNSKTVHIVLSMIWLGFYDMLTDYFTADVHFDALTDALNDEDWKEVIA